MLIVYNKEGNNTTMLPEEQLFNISKEKQASIFFGHDGSSGMFFQQGNLGGKAFKHDEDPLTALLGEEFNAKYRDDYADTLNNSWFSGDNRLTSQTGARLIKDLDKMDARGIAALRGLAQNPERAIAWMKDINNGKVGINGYSIAQANKDTSDIANKINLIARIHKTGDTGLFNQIAKDYVRGTFGDTINGLRETMSTIPDYAKPFVRDLSGELNNETFIRRQNGMNVPGPKAQSTTPTGEVDEGTFTGKQDNKESGSILEQLSGGLGSAFSSIKEKLGPAGDYILPALLLGALGGGINKSRGGSFLAPMLLMLMLGGMYGMGRKNNLLGSSDNTINKTIDSVNNTIKGYGSAGYNKLKEYGKAGYEKAKTITEPYVTKATEYITSRKNPAIMRPAVMAKTSGLTKFSNYNNATIVDLLR